MGGIVQPTGSYNYEKQLKTSDPILKIAANESMLLNWFLARMQNLDPDIIVGHNLLDSHFDLILRRCQKFKITNWPKLGRIKTTTMPEFRNNRAGYGAALGRPICDLKISATELIK